MLTSFSEFKFFQSFRIPVESADEIRFLVEVRDGLENWVYVEDAKLIDVSSSGIGFSSINKFSTGTELRMSLNFKKLNLSLHGRVVRSFTSGLHDETLFYGVEIEDSEARDIHRLLEQYIYSFTPERLRDCLVQVALTDRYTRASEGFEMFSLILSLFKDMTNFGEKKEFIETMLEEVARVINASRATIFLINPESNELEAFAALGTKEEILKFDYRKGIAGSVFTTGVSLNIDVTKDGIRYSEEMDKKTGFKTKSIICCPIYNREDKIIGVIEVLNKRNEDRFSVEDEKTMKVLALIFSSVFHNYNPISDQTRIRRFSTPYDRENVLIGNSKVVSDLRKSIVKLKDLDSPLLICGELGVGKTVTAKIIHEEGNRGLNHFEVIECGGFSDRSLENSIFGGNGVESKLEQCKGGTLVFRDITLMPLDIQARLCEVLVNRRLPNSEISLDLRVVCTSIFDIRKMVEIDGQFNRDLFEYISSSYIYLEPLRNRRDDIISLVDYYVRRECKNQGFLLKSFSPAVMDTFVNYDWPGNIAEVQEAVRKAVLYNPKTHIISNIENSVSPIIDKRRSVLGGLADISHFDDANISLKDKMILVEREVIFAEIKRFGGNKSKAAMAMGISREALRKKILAGDKLLQKINEREESIANKVA